MSATRNKFRLSFATVRYGWSMSTGGLPIRVAAMTSIAGKLGCNPTPIAAIARRDALQRYSSPSRKGRFAGFGGFGQGRPIEHGEKCGESFGENAAGRAIGSQFAVGAVGDTQSRLQRPDHLPHCNRICRPGEGNAAAASPMAGNKTRPPERLRDLDDMIVRKPLFGGEGGQRDRLSFHPGENDQEAQAEVGVLGQLHAHPMWKIRL